MSWTNGLNVWCGSADDTDRARALQADAMESTYQLPFERFEKWCPYGSPDAIAEFLAPYVEAGCHIFNLILQAPTPDRAIEAAAEIRRQLSKHT